MPLGPDHAFANGGTYPAPEHAPLPRVTALLHRVGRAALRTRRADAAWRSFRRGSEISDDCLLGYHARCVNHGAPGTITIGSRTVCRGVVRREPYGDGRITIGRAVYIGDDCLLSSSERIEIGDETMLAHGVHVFDNGSHPREPNARARDWRIVREGLEVPRTGIDSAPVVIGPGAWIGFNSIVLMGVSIEEGAIVGAGSVVTRDVPAYAVCAGNPARVVANSPRRA